MRLARAAYLSLAVAALALATSTLPHALLDAQAPATAGAPQGPGRGAGGVGAADTSGADFSPKPPLQPRTPAEQAKSFVLPAGYRLELVAADPDLDAPAVIDWDGNGRMYVSEFRTYMTDAEATGEHDAKNRISRWEDTNGDGTYDKHTVFADNLVFPRMILPLDNGSILTNETHSDDVLQLWDTNGDGVADKRQVFYTGVGRGRDGNVEHEQSGFIWNLDNWIYSTYNAFRFRWTPSGIQREPTAPNGASWGLTRDDDGKPWFINAGAERGPVNFQFPIQYGALSLDDGFEPGFDTVWPAPSIADMQGGMRRTRQPIGALNHFTATAGAEIYRGDRLPADARGDLFFTEPVGRLIRRAKIVKTDGLTQLRNATPGSEFVLGTDPLFRPVFLKTGPDGAIYIADMYHGIIQERQWSGPGTYLRAKIEQYQLDKITGYGRIWRLRYDGTPAGPPTMSTPIPASPALPLDFTRPRLLDETAAQLVRHLSHPNGWWRDTAQRLIVLKQDASVVSALRALARSPDTLVTRFHALWSLEGLGALDAALVREAIADPNPRMRVQGLRASETLYKKGDRSFAADYTKAAGDADADVAMQALLTMNLLKVANAKATIEATAASNKLRGVQEVAKLLLTPPPATTAPAGVPRTAEQDRLMERGAQTYVELCFECHGSDGRGTPMKDAPAGTLMAPPLAGSPRVEGHRDFVIRTLLHGLTGPLDGQSYVQVMIPMGAQSDEWVAAVGSYVRNSFGNSASFITPADVARVRAASAGRRTLWTTTEIEAALPVVLQPQPSWRVTASHNPTTAPAGLTFTGWTTGTPQQPGMWFQVELPEPAMLTEVQFDAAGGGNLGSTAARGGGRGRGAAAGAGAAAAGAGGPAAAAAAAAAAPTPPPPVLGYARQYQVQVSMDGKAWGTPVASGAGAPLISAAFRPVRAKFVRITLMAPPSATGGAPGAAAFTTAAAGAPPAWVLQNLRLLTAPPPSAAGRPRG